MLPSPVSTMVPCWGLCSAVSGAAGGLKIARCSAVSGAAGGLLARLGRRCLVVCERNNCFPGEDNVNLFRDKFPSGEYISSIGLKVTRRCWLVESLTVSGAGTVVWAGWHWQGELTLQGEGTGRKLGFLPLHWELVFSDMFDIETAFIALFKGWMFVLFDLTILYFIFASEFRDPSHLDFLYWIFPSTFFMVL